MNDRKTLKELIEVRSNSSTTKQKVIFAQARISIELKRQVEEKMTKMKAYGKRMTWQILIESACIEFLSFDDGD
jgi:hypothetical protein